MSDVLSFIRDLVATRGGQLIARYSALGLVALSAKLGVTFDVAGLASGLGTLVVAGLLLALDHFSHAKQAELVK